MKLSIVIINFNSINFTIDCIKSIYEHPFREEYEIILVDNYSNEDPAETIGNLFPRVKYIRLNENIGFAKGNNVGINHSSGEVILLLNNDTLMEKDNLDICYKQITANLSVGALTCQLRYPDGRIQHNCQSFPSSKKDRMEKLRLHKLMSKEKRSGYMQGFYWDYSKPGTPDWIWGTYFMFRRDLLKKLPHQKLDDEYFMYFEDMQWCWDIRKAGFEIYYTPATFVTHFGGGSGGDKEHLMKESLQLFQKKTQAK